MPDVDGIARVCHEANRAYCETIGDTSHFAWEFAPDWQKESAIEGVRTIMDDPGITPQKLHEKWMAEKEQAGWVHGNTKDEALKTNPCIMPYGYLPRAQRVKDVLFQAVARALLG